MNKALFLLSSATLTGGVIVWAGWPALFAIAALSICTIFISSGPPHFQSADEDPLDMNCNSGVPAAPSAARARIPAMGNTSIVSKSSIDDGWYYPITDAALLAPVSDATFDELRAAERQVAALYAMHS